MASRKLNLSAIALFLLFGVVVYGGAELVSFERVADPLIADAVASRATQQVDSSMQPFVSAWADVTGVAKRARRLSLQIVLTETPDDITALEQAMSQLAENSPTMVSAWLALAETRSARGAPRESVLAAFRMSALTGSHEGYMMMQRAMFGLEHWTELPEFDRRTVIRDLLATVSVWEHLGNARQRYRRILAAKSAAEQDDIRAALVASGAIKNVLQALGV
jgi:hypothetical protein